MVIVQDNNLYCCCLCKIFLPTLIFWPYMNITSMLSETGTTFHYHTPLFSTNLSKSILVSPCPNARLSVCGRNHVCSLSSTILGRYLSYLYTLSTKPSSKVYLRFIMILTLDYVYFEPSQEDILDYLILILALSRLILTMDMALDFLRLYEDRVRLSWTDQKLN